MHLHGARRAVESPGNKMAEPVLGQAAGVHRPRNLDWKRAAALLYGDWGTSKAYVIGLAFLAAGYASLPIILAVCVLTGLVGINYAVICRYFPDGGGVYSAARSQGRLLAVVGALLLIADLTVTALGIDPGQYGTVVPEAPTAAAPPVPDKPSVADEGTVV